MTIIYTDGACKGNGKENAQGGYGVYIEHKDGRTQKIWGGEPNTTNNRMELMAAIVALETTHHINPVTLYTDSAYVQNGIEKWLVGWKKNNWKKSNNQPVMNLNLWQRLDTATQNRTIDWQWIKGHAGHAGNEMADRLANQGVHGAGNEITDNYTPQDSKTIISQTTPATAQKASSKGLDDRYFDDTHPNDNFNNYSFDIHHNANALANTNNNPYHKTTSLHTKDGNTANQKNIEHQEFDGDTSRYNPHFVPILPQPINKTKPDRQLIIDTETTGFDDKGGDRIVEIGAIEMVGRKMTGEKLHVYLNPEKQMNEEVIKIHGISNEFVSDKPKFAEIAQHVYDFFEGAELIAHNAAFDMRFLAMEFERAGFKDFEQKVQVLDSLALAKHHYPGQKNSLDMLVKRLNVGKKDRTFHGALLDSEILGEVYLAMTGGQVSLAIEIDESLDNKAVSQFEDLSSLSQLLIKTSLDTTEDEKWRQAVLS